MYQDRGKVNFNLQHYQDAVHDYSMSIQIFRKKIDYAFEIDASSQEISHLESALAYVFFYRSGAFEKLGQSTNAKKDLEIYNTLITTYRY